MNDRDRAFLERIRRGTRAPIADLLDPDPIEVDCAAGRIKVAFQGKAEFLNVTGGVQGGILVAMLDNVMAYAAFAMTDFRIVVPTLQLQASFLAPARPGRIVGEGRVARMGRTIAFLEGRLSDDSGELLVTATASALIRPRPEGAGP